jgi:hypothetical protein
MMQQVLKTKEPAVSEILDLSFLYKYSTTVVSTEEEGYEEGDEEQEDEGSEGSVDELKDEPHACILQPVLETFEEKESSKVVGFIIAVFPWSHIFKNDELIQGMYAVLNDKCSSTSHTYFIDERSVEYLGPRDLHEVNFNYLGTHKEFELSEEEEEEEEEDDEDRFRSRVLWGDDGGHSDNDDDDDDSMCTVRFFFVISLQDRQISIPEHTHAILLYSTTSTSIHQIFSTKPMYPTNQPSTPASL